MATTPQAPLTASGLLGSLYSTTLTGPKNTVSDPTNMESVEGGLAGSAGRAGRTADALGGAGAKSLQPVLNILSKLLGGDRTAAMEGAAPEVAKVSDQYDAARKSIQQTTPRGGARAQAIAESRLKEAGSITDTLNTQRSEALKTAASLGTTLTAQGIQATSVETQGLSDLLASLTQQHGQDMQFLSSLMSGISDIIGKGVEFGF
jgi:hypothetical protein